MINLDTQAGARCVALFLFFGTLAVFAPTLDHGFVYDDSHSIVDNESLRDWRKIPSYFIDPGAFSAIPQARMYRPLLLTSYALNFTVGGSAGFHLVNILCHALAVILLWILLRRLHLAGSDCLLVAMLFAMHPLTTEPVNYISSRSSSLATLCLLAGMIALIGPVTSRRALRLAGWTLAGVLTKATGIVLVPLAGWYLLIRGQLSRWRLILGALVVAMVYVLFTRTIVVGAFAEPVRGYAAQWSTQIKALPFYLHLLLMPTGLSIEPQFAISPGPMSAPVILSLLFMVSLAAVMWLKRSADWRILLGGGWFLLALAPTLLVPLNVLVNEHRLYAALPGVMICLALLAVHLGRRLMIVWVCLLTVLTMQRNQDWSSPVAIWQAAVASSPLMPRAHINLGKVLLERGQFDEAIETSRRGLDLDPDLARGHYNVATAHLHLNRHEQAIAGFQRALELNPQMQEAWINLGNAYKELGRYPDAIDGYRHALQISVRGPIYHNLGSTFLAASLYDSAATNFGEALKAGEARRETFIGLARSLRRAERLQESEQALAAALQSYPADGELLELLAQTQAALGRHGQALATYERTHRPMSEIRLRLGEVAMGRGDLAQAVSHFQQGIADAPDNAPLRNAMGEARWLEGEREQALSDFRHAAQLDPSLSVAFRNIGLVFLHHDRYVEALAALQRALDHEDGGGESKTWELLAHVYEGQSKLSLAIEAYDQAIQRAPGRAVLYYNLGVLHKKAGALVQAERLFGEAMARDRSLFESRE